MSKSIKSSIDDKNNKFYESLEKTSEKKMLLLEAPSNADKIRRELGWNEPIKEAEKELGKFKELKDFVDRHGKDIISLDDIMIICVENNYAMAPLEEYLGPATDELALVIGEYTTKNDQRLSYARENLQILAPFEYFNGDPLKLRTKTDLGEILLLDKINNANIGENTVMYKIYSKTGKRRPMIDFFKSLTNTNENSTGYLVLLGILTLIYTIVVAVHILSPGTGYNIFRIDGNLIFVIFLYCFIATLVMWNNSNCYMKHTENKHFNLSFMRSFNNIGEKPKIISKVRWNSMYLIITSAIVCLLYCGSLLHFGRMHTLKTISKDATNITMDISCHCTPQDPAEWVIYHKTSPITYQLIKPKK